jgi:hypothetical protein
MRIMLKTQEEGMLELGCLVDDPIHIIAAKE